MKIIKYPLIMILIILSITSCREGGVYEEIVVEEGREYFPLSVGKYIDYQVDSIVFDFDGSVPIILQSTTYVREEIIEEYEDEEGDTAYRIERFEKASLNDDWQIKDVWTSKQTENIAEKTEENVRLIKMVFPLRQGADFDATLYVADDYTVSIAEEAIEPFKNWDAEIITVDDAMTVGDFTFSNVTEVLYADDENLIEKRYSKALYAKDVGMVYKEEWILDTQILDDLTPWEEKAEKGYILTQTIIDYN